MERMRGKRLHDIELPRDPKTPVDKRLEKPDVLGALGKARKGLQSVRELSKKR